MCVQAIVELVVGRLCGEGPQQAAALARVAFCSVSLATWLPYMCFEMTRKLVRCLP